MHIYLITHARLLLERKEREQKELWELHLMREGLRQQTATIPFFEAARGT